MLRGLKRDGAPLWAAAVQMAERWHVPPWVVWERPDALRWLLRARAYDEEAEDAREGRPFRDLADAPADAFALASAGIPYVIQASEDD